MDQSPLAYLDFVTDTGDLVDNQTFQQAEASGDYSALSPIHPETGELLNITPVNNPGLPQPASSPPPSGYAWMYTTQNDRVPVLVSAIPSYYFQFMSADQINIPAASMSGPGAAPIAAAGAAPMSGMGLWLALGVGAYFLLFRKGKSLF